MIRNKLASMLVRKAMKSNWIPARRDPMKELRRVLAVLVLLGLAYLPARVATAQSGQGLTATGLVEWLTIVAPQEVESVMTLTEAAPTATPCSSDFLVARVQEELAQIADRLEGKAIGLVGPAVCAVTWIHGYMSAGFSQADGRPNTLLVHGYNFGPQASLPVVYVTHSAGTMSLQSVTRMINHTLLMVDLSAGDLPYCDLKDAVLTVAWSGKELFGQRLLFTPCATDVGDGHLPYGNTSSETTPWVLEPAERHDDGTRETQSSSLICAHPSAMAWCISEDDFIVP